MSTIIHVLFIYKKKYFANEMMKNESIKKGHKKVKLIAIYRMEIRKHQYYII